MHPESYNLQQLNNQQNCLALTDASSYWTLSSCKGRLERMHPESGNLHELLSTDRCCCMQDVVCTAKDVSDACTSAAASASHYAHLQQPAADGTTSQTAELLSSVTTKYMALRAVFEGE